MVPRRLRNFAGELLQQSDVRTDVRKMILEGLTDVTIGERLGLSRNRIREVRKSLENAQEVPTRMEVRQRNQLEKAQQEEARKHARLVERQQATERIRHLYETYDDCRMVSKALGYRVSPATVRRLCEVSAEDQQLARDLYDEKIKPKVRTVTGAERQAPSPWFWENYCISAEFITNDDLELEQVRTDLTDPCLSESERRPLFDRMGQLESMEKIFDPEIVALKNELENYATRLWKATHRYEARYGGNQDENPHSQGKNSKQREKDRRQIRQLIRRRYPRFGKEASRESMADQLYKIFSEDVDLATDVGPVLHGNDLANILALRLMKSDLVRRIRELDPQIVKVTFNAYQCE